MPCNEGMLNQRNHFNKNEQKHLNFIHQDLIRVKIKDFDNKLFLFILFIPTTYQPPDLIAGLPRPRGRQRQPDQTRPHWQAKSLLVFRDFFFFATCFALNERKRDITVAGGGGNGKFG